MSTQSLYSTRAALLDPIRAITSADTMVGVLAKLVGWMNALPPSVSFSFFFRTGPNSYALTGHSGPHREFSPEKCRGLCTKQSSFFTKRALEACQGLQSQRVAACIPIVVANKPFAVVHLCGVAELDVRRAATDIEILSVAAAENWKKIEAIRTAQHEARTDWLTGLLGARGFHERLEEELSSARGWDSTLALVLFDLDRFKGYNDRFGHPAGSRLLKNFGGLLRTVAHEGETAARIGGDEFALILPGGDLAAAIRRAQAVHDQIQDLRDLSGGAAIGVSAGATARGKFTSGEAFEELADQALYFAKRNGRNCIAFQSQSGEIQIHGQIPLGNIPSEREVTIPTDLKG